MSFFEDLPEPAPSEAALRYVEPDWRRIPYEIVPSPVPLSQLIHASGDTALVVHGVAVYPSGLTFQIVATRHPEAAPPERPMHEVIHGGPDQAGALRIGVLHEDGTRAEHPTDLRRHTPGPPDAYISSRGGGGTRDASSGEFFVWPLPATGDLTLLFRWTSAGLDEARVVLDGDALRAAAAQTTEIWPGAVVPPPTQHGGLEY